LVSCCRKAIPKRAALAAAARRLLLLSFLVLAAAAAGAVPDGYWLLSSCCCWRWLLGFSGSGCWRCWRYWLLCFLTRLLLQLLRLRSALLAWADRTGRSLSSPLASASLASGTAGRLAPCSTSVTCTGWTATQPVYPKPGDILLLLRHSQV
jgi:hypothetical protein